MMSPNDVNEALAAMKDAAYFDQLVQKVIWEAWVGLSIVSLAVVGSVSLVIVSIGKVLRRDRSDDWWAGVIFGSLVSMALCGLLLTFVGDLRFPEAAAVVKLFGK